MFSRKSRNATMANSSDRILENLASQSAVVVFGISTCCMCHVVKRLFYSLGVNPMVYEIDQELSGRQLHKALIKRLGTSMIVPVVFVGGRLVGTMDSVMSAHINGTLVPLLKDAGALWL